MMNSKIYKAVPINDATFTQNELRLLKVAYFEDISELEGAMEFLGIDNFDTDLHLIDCGYVLASIGPLSDLTWVLYHKDNSIEKVVDIRDGYNFYDLYLVDQETAHQENPETSELVFSKIYLSPDNIEKEISKYVELDLETRTSNYPVFSEFIQ